MEARNHFTHLALAGGLAAVLALGGMTLPGTMAFATDGTATQGDITINANTHVTSDTTTLLGYQLFKADVADQTVGSTTSKAVSNITWGSPQAQKAVEDAIKAIEPTYAGKTAQDAADWLSAHASGSGSATVVDANDAFGKIAAAMRTAGATAITITPGTKATLNEGYWLFVTNSDTTSDYIDKVGTAPIYAVVGGSAVTVDQKSSQPTVNKFIKNDATGSRLDKGGRLPDWPEHRLQAHGHGRHGARELQHVLLFLQRRAQLRAYGRCELGESDGSEPGNGRDRSDRDPSARR